MLSLLEYALTPYITQLLYSTANGDTASELLADCLQEEDDEKFHLRYRVMADKSVPKKALGNFHISVLVTQSTETNPVPV